MTIIESSLSLTQRLLITTRAIMKNDSSTTLIIWPLVEIWSERPGGEAGNEDGGSRRSPWNERRLFCKAQKTGEEIQEASRSRRGVIHRNDVLIQENNKIQQLTTTQQKER